MHEKKRRGKYRVIRRLGKPDLEGREEAGVLVLHTTAHADCFTLIIQEEVDSATSYQVDFPYWEIVSERMRAKLAHQDDLVQAVEDLPRSSDLLRLVERLVSFLQVTSGTFSPKELKEILEGLKAYESILEANFPS